VVGSCSCAGEQDGERQRVTAERREMGEERGGERGGGEKEWGR
jgi:hypothetical protein